MNRGEREFLHDRILQLSAEALILRVGEFAKQLVEAEPHLGTDPMWSHAARTRDFVAHHYHAIDSSQLWATVSDSLAQVGERVKGLVDD